MIICYLPPIKGNQKQPLIYYLIPLYMRKLALKKQESHAQSYHEHITKGEYMFM